MSSQEARNNRVARDAAIEQMLGSIRDYLYYERCPKCGFNKFNKGYCAGAGVRNPAELMAGPGGNEPVLKCPVKGEHLHIGCGGCQYSWIERCKDDPENPPMPERGGRLIDPAAVLQVLLERSREPLEMPHQEVQKASQEPRPIMVEVHPELAGYFRVWVEPARSLTEKPLV
jgi:hypothetical protein